MREVEKRPNTWLAWWPGFRKELSDYCENNCNYVRSICVSCTTTQLGRKRKKTTIKNEPSGVNSIHSILNFSFGFGSVNLTKMPMIHISLLPLNYSP